jgi:hypothetical protein
MRRYLIHYVLIVNFQEKKLSSVFRDDDLPKTYDGYLDVQKFCEDEKEAYILKHRDENYFSHIPQVHMISISEVPKLVAEPSYA